MARRGRADLSGSPASPAHRSRSARARHATQKSESTRRQLLKAAVSILARDGFAALNLGAVAKEAGLTRGCVQYYFPSQVDLVLALADQLAHHRRQTVAEVADGTSRDVVAFGAAALANLEMDVHRLAEQELLIAARTQAPLRERLAGHVRDLEAQVRSAVAHMTDDDGFADSVRFRAGRDLARLVGHFAHAEIWPDRGESRIADMREALVFALRVIWAGGSPGVETAKPRIRMAAVSGRR